MPEVFQSPPYEVLVHSVTIDLILVVRLHNWRPSNVGKRLSIIEFSVLCAHGLQSFCTHFGTVNKY